jgi:hypothetical protein
MRSAFVLLLILFVSCRSTPKKTTVSEEGSDAQFSFEDFSNAFKKLSLPYQLTDTDLLKNNDTAALQNFDPKPFISDSLLSKGFGKGSKLKYIPIGEVAVPKKETYFFIKTVGGSARAAYLLVFDAQKNFSASLPFLVPDDDESTTQVSTFDRSQTISRNTTKKTAGGNTKEGRDVYVYNNSIHQFTLIMTDLMDESVALINPIDTLRKTQKWTGDYINGKNNLVSVRDGRSPNERMIFIHFEKEEGSCKGELKGNFLMAASNTAIYRQGSDACVLTLRFEGSSVNMHEENCGNHRDVKCLFEGIYTRRALPKEKPKTNTKKSPPKKAPTP